MPESGPLISVIIPCFNQAKYLARAIESVRSQSYRHHQIIVVDDGSKDETRFVADSFPEVSYVYQANQGLSAARNTGIAHSSGKYLLFLDSDDWLAPDALKINLDYLIENPELAFVSGAHELYFEKTYETARITFPVAEDNYCQFLLRNYVAMIATALFQRWVFDSFSFDTSLKACEDYDLYLKITRKYPTLQHDQMLATYRIHNENMSKNYPMMLNAALTALNRQKGELVNKKERIYFKRGIEFWKLYYSDEMHMKLLDQLFSRKPINRTYYYTIRKNNITLYAKFSQMRLWINSKRFLKGLIPPIITNKLGLKPVYFNTDHVNFGDLNRTEPLSLEFGYDRGGPIDRYYIENFLEKNKEKIKGTVLEIGDNEYTMRFGGDRVSKSEILHVNASNPHATYVGDLTYAPMIPDDHFDCIILTQTLQLIYQPIKALETCHRILKKGGVLLLTVPGITQIDQDEWKDIWLWSFTQRSITQLLIEFFDKKNIQTQTYGNVLVASAFLYGLGLPEIEKSKLDVMDPHYQVIISASAIKS